MTSLTHKQKEGKSHGNGIYNHISWHADGQLMGGMRYF